MTGKSLLDQPHHDGSPLYVADAAPSLGDVVPVRVWAPRRRDGSPGADTIVARAIRDGEPKLYPAVVEQRLAHGDWWRADVVAHNPVTSYRFMVSSGGGYAWLNAEGLFDRDVTDASDFRLIAHPGPPDWVLDQVVYQVFPDRYARSGAVRPLPAWAEPAGWDEPVIHKGRRVPAQFYGGDLDGVVARLDHIVALGATAIYLTPVFESESNHRYDATSFDHVDPVLGGDEALRRLLEAAHRIGLRVVGDLTTNHTGIGHLWFAKAQADPTSTEAGFYRFRRHPDEYEMWLSAPTLPKLDHASEALRSLLYSGEASVIARWLREGLDGWRIDVANMTGRMGADDHSRAVAQAIRATATAIRPDAWVLAEHGHDASGDLLGDGWHGTMDYSGFTRPVWTWLNGGSPRGPGLPHGLDFLGLPLGIPVMPATASVATMRQMHAAMPWRSWAASTSHLDTHDTARFRTVTGGGVTGWIDQAGRGRDRHIVGLALQMTLPGVPSVFMGDEIGLTGVDGEHSRTPFPWDRRAEWDAPTLEAYRAWIGLRRDSIALRRGGLRWVHVGEHAMTFLREHAEQRVLVHVARADHPAVRLPLAALGLASASQAHTLQGEPPAQSDGALLLPSTGPSAHAYALVS